MADRQLLGTFRDQRVNTLWALSDTLTLREVHRRHPHILPDDEWALIEENQEMCLNGLDHYAASPNHNFDFSPEKVEQEWLFLSTSLRWRAVQELWHPSIYPPKRAMDFGCHTGAHAVNMSNWWPDAQVFAREIVADLAPAIDYTIGKYAAHPEHIHFDIGDHRNPMLPRDLDLLFAGEVFEHMIEWREFITALEGACRPGGQVIITVPFGPWEAMNDRHIHVGHWDVADLFDVFGQKAEFKVLEIRNHSPNKMSMGWTVATWLAHTGPLGEIDYDRKLAAWGF